MTFTYDSFLRPTTSNDKNIIIQDINGRVIHTINPFAVINTFVNNNLLKISLSSDRVITLNFLQDNLARLALNSLQQRITLLKEDKPQFIDKQVENYVEDYVDNKIVNNKIQIINTIENQQGVANYIPRWTSATALSQTGSIYDDGKSISIGKTSSRAYVNIIGTEDRWNVTNLKPNNIDSLLDTPWFAGGYGLTTSLLFAEGTIDGLASQFIDSTTSSGYVSYNKDRKPLARLSATGWGTTLVVENVSPVRGVGNINYQGQQTLPTYFRGPDPLFLWEDTQTGRQLKLERTSLSWEFSVPVINPNFSQYNHISFQRSGWSIEFLISATINAGQTHLPNLFGEANFAPNVVGAPVFSGYVILTPSVNQVTPSNQITFDDLTNKNSVVSGMSVPVPGSEEINRRFEPSLGSWVNLFPSSPPIIVQSVVGNTVILSATPSYALQTTDKIYFAGLIPPSTVGLGRALVKIVNGVALPTSDPAPVRTTFALQISKPLLRALYPGDTFVINYPAGGVGIGTNGRPDFKLNVIGGAIIDNNIILRNGKVTTNQFKLNVATPTTSNFNLLVGDQFGDSRWVPVGQVAGIGFSSTSSTQLTIGPVGSYFQIKTQPFLSYSPGQVVVLYDELSALYVTASYVDGFGSNKIVAEIDGYNFNSGTLSLVTLYSQNVGSSSNKWNINLSGAVGPQGPAGFNQGTFSVTGDIIPDQDYTFNLGSPTKRWDNIYVKDARVASQSLFLGDVKLSVTTDGVINVDNRAINRYNGTSSTPYTIEPVGSVVSFQTNKFLSYLKGESIRIQNRIKSDFEEVGYSEESIHGFFKAVIDFYNPDTGLMELVISFTENVGFYSDTWLLDLDVDTSLIGAFLPPVTTNTDGLKLIGTSSTLITVPQIGEIRDLFTQVKLGFNAGQQLIVYSGIPNNYEDDDYVDDGNLYFIGKVDYYDSETGRLSIVSNYSVGTQSSSDWTITISGISSEELVGMTGPQGPAGISPSIRNDSFSGSSVTITHNFGYYPVVQVINTIGEVISPSNITHPSSNTFIVDFGASVSGTIISGAGIMGATGPQGGDGSLIGGTLSNNLVIYGQNYDILGLGLDNITLTSSVFDVNSDLISLDSSDNIQILADNDITIFANSNLNLLGNTILNKTSQVVESVTTITSSTITYDFTDGLVWYNDNLVSNYTANFINLPLDNNRIVKSKLIISQGATAYRPSNLQIDGVTQSISWKSGTYSITPNGTDIIELDFLRIGNTWSSVFGQIDNFI